MTQRRALQIVVALAGLVPVLAGLLGQAPAILGLSGDAAALTHAAYLSGLLAGIGLAFWSTIPAIEKRSEAFGLLAAIVVLGGLARLIMAARIDVWTLNVTLPLAMELLVTPALWLWQRRIAKSA
ncbi:MAG: DUF4345 domain-containing protein [Rhizomicrobium sp.]